ncbi:MAG TPA: hypothetical protein VFA24_04920 [Gaiellaceae bacterium]|nr:hypothetical protein [Gaiellaceae bacterium]
MHHLAFSMEFRGHSTPLSPGVLTTRATAPSGGLLTRIDGRGVHGEFQAVDGGEALIERRLTFVDDTAFEEVGTMSFGRGNSLRWRSVGLGMLAPSADAGLRHGTVASVVDGGAGAFAHASGRIVSNFLLAESGEITDRELGVVFVEVSV